MHQHVFFRSLIALACTVFLHASANAAPTPIPAAPSINASAYLVIEHHSGRVIAQKNPDQQVEPASITKLMTAYVAFDKLREGQVALTDEITVSEKAWRAEGSRMYIEVGKKVRMDQLLKGMIIQSGNDASIAIAEHIAGTEETFAALMNQYAGKLGMTSSYFANSNGLPAPGHKMSARDIVTLTQRLIDDFPDHYPLYSEKSFTFNDIAQYNRNNLLWRDASVDGVKTGFTEAARYCLVSSAKRGEMRVISVVLGTPSEEARIASSQSLINYAFNFYETHKLYAAGQVITTEPVFKGTSETTDLGLTDDLFVTIPRGQYESLGASMNLPNTLIAPLTADKAIGSVVVRLNDQTLAERDLFPVTPVQSGSFFRRAIDEVRLWFE
ncbi:MAG: D-alanyl-D-alanine carboxypeptidase family protein [Gammaproteobacteria bacterium]